MTRDKSQRIGYGKKILYGRLCFNSVRTPREINIGKIHSNIGNDEEQTTDFCQQNI